MCCWSPACAISQLLTQKLVSEELPGSSSSGSHSAVVLQTSTWKAKMGNPFIFRDAELFLELSGEKNAFLMTILTCIWNSKSM